MLVVVVVNTSPPLGKLPRGIGGAKGNVMTSMLRFEFEIARERPSVIYFFTFRKRCNNDHGDGGSADDNIDNNRDVRAVRGRVFCSL